MDKTRAYGGGDAWYARLQTTEVSACASSSGYKETCVSSPLSRN